MSKKSLNPSASPASTSAYVSCNGTLICFRCDVSPSPENRVRSAHEGHASLFNLAEGHVHKLQGSINSITAKLASDALHGKAVKIKGICYTETNHMLVEKVVPLGRSTAGRAPFRFRLTPPWLRRRIRAKHCNLDELVEEKQ
ncbi:MAG: hypothetical protein HOP18_04335 [Deltaproteobacteria bacterium]|nr:hypothetical protein [Deltaproteobacteria bacterium]